MEKYAIRTPGGGASCLKHGAGRPRARSAAIELTESLKLMPPASRSVPEDGLHPQASVIR